MGDSWAVDIYNFCNALIFVVFNTFQRNVLFQHPIKTSDN